jgi:hypothetical protein
MPFSIFQLIFVEIFNTLLRPMSRGRKVPMVQVSFGMGIHSSRRSFPSRSAGGIQSDDSAYPKVCGVDSSRHGGTGMTRSRKCPILPCRSAKKELGNCDRIITGFQ